MSETAEKWQIGNVVVTRIVESEAEGLPPGVLFHDLTEEQVKGVPWLVPAYADPDGTLRLSIHAFVVESSGRKIIVDTCVGNDKARTAPQWSHMHTPFLESLTAAGLTTA